MRFAYAAAWAWSRVALSIHHRPWTVDLVSGVQIAALSVFFWADPTSLLNRGEFSFLDRMPAEWLEWVMFACGVAQIAAALLNIFWWRWIMALLVMWHWCAFAIGLRETDQHAAAVVLMVCSALANAFIVACLY